MFYYIFSALQQVPPTFTKDTPLKPQINIAEGQPLSVSFSLHGNPKPNVTVTFDGISCTVSVLRKDYVYTYTAISGFNVSRSHCNKTLKVTGAADGSSKTVQAEAKVIVECEYPFFFY